jgi:hypothetical protein
MNVKKIFQKREFPVWAAEAFALLGLAIYFLQAISLAHSTVSNLDEGSYLLKGFLFATGKYQPFEPGISTGKAPLAFLIPGYVQLWFGAGVRTGRYLAVFFGVMAVIGTWLAARRISGKWLAAAAVWTLALSPMIIKYYSGGATQSTIACLLAWTLALALGEGRKFWELALAGILAAAMMFVRQNMMPVLPLLILYAFWQHGRKAWGLAFAGTLVTVSLFYAYWPDILQLWGWVPYLSKSIPATATYHGGGVPVHWLPKPSLDSRLLSIFQAVKYHFIPLAGSLLSIFFLPKIKEWRTSANMRAGVFLFVLFTGLLYMHFEAAIALDYCVFCFSPYIAFFNVAGILLVALFVKSWQAENRRILPALFAALFFLAISTGLGFSAFDRIGKPLLNLPAPRVRDLQILPGFVTWWQLLSNKFDWEYNIAMRYASAGFGLLVGMLFLLIGYIIWRRTWRARSGFGVFFTGLVLLLGVVLSPLMHGHVSDCDTDVIAANEQVGAHLRRLIPPGSLVYWHGGLSAAPLLYLPDARIFPPQINAGYSYLEGAKTEQVIKFGYWNEVLKEEWKSTADFFLIEEQYYMMWKDFLRPRKFDELPPTPAGTSCLPKSQIRIFRRK